MTQLHPQSGGPAHARCGWINYPMVDSGITTFQRNAGFFNAIHPLFYVIDNTFTLQNIQLDPSQLIQSAAQAAGTALWPMIGGPSDVNGFGQLLNDPGRRAAHVQALVSELGNPAYSGFEIDYEGFGELDIYQAGFLQFLRDLTDQAHDLGKEISITIGPWTTEQASAAFYPGSPYNYTMLLDIVDYIHLQFYDFHRYGGTHIGPVAPAGWVADTLEVVVNTGAPGRFIYGMPNYGLTVKVLNGDPDPYVPHDPTDLQWGFDSLNQLQAKCDPSTFEASTEHMIAGGPTCNLPPELSFMCCSYLNPGQLFSPGLAPNCQQAGDRSTFQVFDALYSLEQRLKLAHDQGLGGVAYYTLGDELDGFFDMVSRYY